MAYAGKQLFSAHAGQQIRFIKTSADTGGELLVMESAWQPFSRRPPLHYHPQQDELFTVLDGRLTILSGDNKHVLQAGDEFHIPAGTVHAMWNAHEEPVKVRWEVRTAMETEFMLEQAMGLSKEGKVSATGMPHIIDALHLARTYRHEFRLAKPKWWIQKMVFNLVAPINYFNGAAFRMKKYVD